jgi:hypothetical protein
MRDSFLKLNFGYLIVSVVLAVSMSVLFRGQDMVWNLSLWVLLWGLFGRFFLEQRDMSIQHASTGLTLAHQIF